MDVYLRVIVRICALAGGILLSACAVNAPLTGENYANVLEMSKDVARRFSSITHKARAYRGRNYTAFENERVRGAAFKLQAERTDKHNIELSYQELCRHQQGVLYSSKINSSGLFEYRCEAYLGGVIFSVITEQADFSAQTGRACLTYIVLEQKDIRSPLRADMYLQSVAPYQQTLNTLAGC